MALWMACLQAFANDNIRMVFVGDMMLAETVGQYIRRGGNPMQHVAHLFKGADITIGNLETAVGTHGEKAQKPFTFLAHPRVIPFLKRNFSAVSVRPMNRSFSMSKENALPFWVMTFFNRAALRPCTTKQAWHGASPISSPKTLHALANTTALTSSSHTRIGDGKTKKREMRNNRHWHTG